MSRELPDRPSLVHLKQQAKDLLDELRRTVPDTQLSDALHTVAREYGFATWPSLKAHVEATASSYEPMPGGQRPLAGRWVADGSALRSEGAPTPSVATLDFVLVGNAVTITHSTVDETGRETRGTVVLDADGVEHQNADTAYATIARWAEPRTLEVATTFRGREVARVTYAVAPDGSTLTLFAASEAHDGFTPTTHRARFSRATFR